MFLLSKKYIIGQRTNITLLTLFFTFAFALLFLALVQNSVHAWTASLPPVRVVAAVHADDIPSAGEYGIVPSFGLKQQAAGFDFDTDDSFQKYLNTDHPFNDSSYIPKDLLPIDSNFTANNAKAFKLRQEAGIEFADMAWHFRDAFSGDKLFITSAYRSKGFQNYLIKQGCVLLKCAPIGTSEHQAGLALDLKVITRGGRGYSLDAAYPNKYSDWLHVHARERGFHNTYQKGVAIDGKIVEGRHRRYLGITLAKILADNGQTLAEYYNTIIQGNN